MLFEELDHQPTPMGGISLRRRRMLTLGIDVWEVKLGDEFLMSSLFTEGEQALARLGLAATAGERLDVVVGGLGLGYTARAALDDARVAELLVIDFLEPVIDWHRRGVAPLGPDLARDPRCRLVHGDFFAMARGKGFDPGRPRRRFDAVLLDIDHSPGALLHAAHGRFYAAAGLKRLARNLKPGGVFAMWSDAPPEAPFMKAMQAAFRSVEATVVEFPNPLTGGQASCTIYIGRL